MTLRLRNIQIDVPAGTLEEAVGFWSAVLDADTRTAGGPFTHLVGPRSLLGVHLQELADGSSRVHLDLAADDVDAEVSRLVELGARRVGQGPCHVLADPGGNVFCVCAGEGSAEHLDTAVGRESRLHVLVVDVASEHAVRTATFWADALGVSAEHLPSPYDPYHRLDGVPVPGGAMRLLVQDVGPGAAPRVHLDLHVPDAAARATEVARLERLGARVQAAHPRWTVLHDPVGTVLCVVSDA